MTTITKMHLAITAAAALLLSGGTALAQHDEHAPAAQPKQEAKAAERIGGPYALDTCPITGKKLGSMGDPLVKMYEGREVRYCCAGCPGRFEKDLPASFAKLDEKIVKDQAPIYPLKVSVVTGKELPAKPYEYVYGNRLVRLGDEGEKAAFLKNPTMYMATLDGAVVEQQGKDYALKTCPVSKEEFGGDMGKPVDVVVAGRLVRLCCKACKKDVEKEPAKFVAMVDEARKGAGHKDGHGGKDGDHKH